MKTFQKKSFTCFHLLLSTVLIIFILSGCNNSQIGSDDINNENNIIDTTKPVIFLNGLNPYTLNLGDIFIDPSATAIDDQDGPVPISTSGTVDTSKIGSYVITYKASDKANNTATKTRTVYVKELILNNQIIYAKLNDKIFINDTDDVVIYIDNNLNKNEKLIYNKEKIKEITKNLYENFEDKYDYIFLVTNNKSRPDTINYSGVFSKIKNDVKGIGLSLYDDTASYGSSGKLKGIMHVAYRQAVFLGPTLHELLHYWANKFRYFDENVAPYYRLGEGSHWGRTGFFGGKGQLGGYDANEGVINENLSYEGIDENYHVYSAKYFGWNSNGGSRIPYNDVELYLMGLLPISEVKDLMLPIPYAIGITNEEVEVLSGEIADRNRKYFMVPFEDKNGIAFPNTGVIRKRFMDILSENNIPARDPDYQNSQKEFKVLTVLLDTEMPRYNEVNILKVNLHKLAFNGDDGLDWNYTFWEATRGIGSLDIDNISETLKTSSKEVVVYRFPDSEDIIFNGLEYKTVISPYTGRIWLDRNIGAKKVCNDFKDKDCRGYYIEWGRNIVDTHGVYESAYTITKETSLINTSNKFIVTDGSSSGDWLKTGVDDDLEQRKSMWSDPDSEIVCPKGFRVPTKTEFEDETIKNEFSESITTINEINNSFLRLAAQGYRSDESVSAKYIYDGESGVYNGLYWTITTDEHNGKVRVKGLSISPTGISFMSSTHFASGRNVRCIKDGF